VNIRSGETLRVDALRTDAYVESLIAGAAEAAGVAVAAAGPAPTEAGAAPAGAGAPAPTEAGAAPAGAALDPGIAAVARLLHATAWRPHPSFRFEERVAARLAAVARGRRLGEDAPAGTLVAFPGTSDTLIPIPGASDARIAFPPAPSAAEPDPRPYVPIAGIASAALASAALSIGAAVLVAWRRGRLRRGLA